MAAIARHGLSDLVTLHGWGSGEEVRASIRAARALVLPSEAEGLPIVIMEAMALARPVISTIVAGIPELLDARCGWIVPPRNLDALAAAIDACLAASPETLAALAAEGRIRIARHHDQEKTAALLRTLVDAADRQVRDPSNVNAGR